LDISECKAVIFYDNPISAIRRIQRAGRTGRTLPGKIFFVVNPDTRDESRYWAGIRKEKKLLSELKLLSDAAKEVSLEKYIHKADEQEPMEHFATIKIDHRERIDEIIHYLREKKIKIELAELPIGDYIIGNILIERKKYDDLASSIIDGRIFNQLKTLASSDYVPLIILEGDRSSFIKRLDEGALNGIILTILIDFKIPIYYSKNELDTAKMLYSLIKRYVEKKHPPPTRLERRPLSLHDIQKFVVAGLPDVDTVLADRLLRHFRTIENVFTASEDELIKVKGIGAKIAKKIRKVLTSDYLSADTSKASDLV
jgi:Fanconi anemia group M protein